MSGSSGRARHAPGARRMPFVVLVLGLIGGGLLGLLALNTASAANEVRRHNIAEADQSVAAQVEQLEIDARNSAAPENLARAAEALGMVPAGNAGFIEIGRGQAVRVLGRPAPATAPPVYVRPTPTSSAHKDRPGRQNQPNRKHKGKRSQGDKRDTHPARDTGHQRPSPTPTATPTPTPTPTPTITLPGGDR